MPSKAPSPKSEKSKMRTLTHHPKYYLPGGDFYILIDTTIFRIHSYFFKREARNFYTKLVDPVSPGMEKGGLSESTAIVVETATVEEFEHFLWVFYNPLYDIYEADIKVWFTILRLAHEWDFPEVTKFALREVRRREEELDLVPRIVLYQKYKAPAEYLVPLFAQLCARPTSPTMEEAALLGHEQTVRIFMAREKVRSSGGVSPLPQGINQRDIYPTISSMLELPTWNGGAWEHEEDFLSTSVNGAPIVKEPVNHRKNNTGRTSGMR